MGLKRKLHQKRRVFSPHPALLSPQAVLCVPGVSRGEHQREHQADRGAQCVSHPAACSTRSVRPLDRLLAWELNFGLLCAWRCSPSPGTEALTSGSPCSPPTVLLLGHQLQKNIDIEAVSCLHGTRLVKSWVKTFYAFSHKPENLILVPGVVDGNSSAAAAVEGKKTSINVCSLKTSLPIMHRERGARGMPF